VSAPITSTSITNETRITSDPARAGWAGVASFGVVTSGVLTGSEGALTGSEGVTSAAMGVLATSGDAIAAGADATSRCRAAGRVG
jgi:hypothetical protein